MTHEATTVILPRGANRCGMLAGEVGLLKNAKLLSTGLGNGLALACRPMSQSGLSVRAGIIQRSCGIGIQHKNHLEFQFLSTSTRTDEVESLKAEKKEYRDEYI